ncbi:DUF3108 domain-containing protein [Roseospira navarrensis]|uniref:DUF3108 domain-containing protein n=1 Tax=Roseospira navarrensis TaxID=140058 RepID=A0A7X1ZD21_9PROT|nr:DUF3108 domain-containing protein [Roseospira navarrensis]MQX35162.1 DUF3108 domain-containing protein [Roseospira navarrensis]
MSCPPPVCPAAPLHWRWPRRALATLLGAAALVVGPGPTAAEESQHLLYEARFLGLPVGDVAVHMTRTDEAYAVTVNGRATGLYWLLKGIRVHREARGRITPDGALEPDSYREAYREWDRQGVRRVDFHGPDGLPQGFKNGRPVDRMEDELRMGALDPLSAILDLRTRVGDLAQAGQTAPETLTLPVYDATVRFDAMVRLGTPTQVTAAGQPWRARVATVTFDPLGGFSDKHAAEYRRGGSRLTLTDHTAAIPLRFELEQGWGAFDLVYVGRCGQVPTPCPDNEVDPLDSTEYTNER